MSQGPGGRPNPALDWDSGFMSGWSTLLPGPGLRAPLTNETQGVTVRGVAHSGGGWMAAARTEGLLILATGRGRGLPLAAALPGVIETTITVSAGEPREGGLPGGAAAVLRLLRATHLDLRQAREVQGEGIEALVAVIAEGRLFVIQAGGGAQCARWRRGHWEVVAPLGDRVRPALGSAARAVIEVTSEPLRNGDLIVAMAAPPSGDKSAWSGILDTLGAWAESQYREPSSPLGPDGPAYAALLYGQVGRMGSPGGSAPEPLAPRETAVPEGGSSPPGPANEGRPWATSFAASDGLTSNPTSTSQVPPEYQAPPETPRDEGEFVQLVPVPLAEASPAPTSPWHDVPLDENDWVQLVPMDAPLPVASPEEPAAVPDIPPIPELEFVLAKVTPVPPASRSRLWIVRGATALIAVLLGLVAVLGAGRIWDRSGGQPEDPLPPARAGSPPPQVAAGLGAGGSGIEALAADAPPAAAMGTLSARTDPATSDVDIYLDDRLVGRSPVVLEHLPVGQHRVRFVGPDHYRWEEEVMVREGEVTEAMAPIDRGEDRALVTVRGKSLSEGGLVEEEGDQVLVDGEDQGTTPLELELEPGMHAITVRRSGDEDALPIIRVLEVRRSDQLILELRVDKPPTFAIEHRPQREIRTGETTLLTAGFRGVGVSLRQSLYLHHASDGDWTKLPMAPVPGAPGTFVLGLPIGPDGGGKTIRYYFSTVDEGGETIFSPIYAVPLR